MTLLKWHLTDYWHILDPSIKFRRTLCTMYPAQNAERTEAEALDRDGVCKKCRKEWEKGQ